jgi:hypothetical protein
MTVLSFKFMVNKFVITVLLKLECFMLSRKIKMFRKGNVLLLAH